MGKWYVVPNPNRMMRFADDFVDIRVYPKSGTCRVLERRRLDWYRVKVYFTRALFETGLDLRVCEALSYTLQYVRRQSRVFLVGQRVPPFKVDYYKESLGLTIKADESHPKHIEIDESYSSWIKHDLATREKLSAQLSRVSEQLASHLSALQEIRDAVRDGSDATKKRLKDESQ